MELGNIFYMPWEEKLLVWLQGIGSESFVQSFLVVLNNIISMFGEEYVCIGVMGLLFWGFDKEKGKRVGFAIILTQIMCGLIKNIFCRLRPWLCCDDIKLLRDIDGFSFPSGHSANAATVFPGVAYEYKGRKWLTVIAVSLPLLVMLSRCYLGAHWPTDVIAGLCLGLFDIFIVELVSRKTGNFYVLPFIVLIIAAAGFFYCRTDDFFKAYGMLVGMLAGVWFEDKYVNFKNTGKVWAVLLRTLGGVLVFVACNLGLKAVFGLFIDEGTTLDMYMKTLRYMIDIFLITGVYPLSFKPLDRYFRIQPDVEIHR